MLQSFARAELPATPWKNGGGSTQEIACWPPGAGFNHFAWRLSIARIAQSGPFSVFAGVQRHIMLLDGQGVWLRSGKGDINHRLDAPHQPFAFDGETEIDCTLLGGPSCDFNAMTRSTQCQAELLLLDRAAAVAPARHGALLCLRGDWALSPSQSVGLDHGLWWADSAHGWHIQPTAPNALMLAVRIFDL